MRGLLLVDIKNLYYTVNKIFGKKLDYQKLIDACAGIDQLRKCAYGFQMDSEAMPFIDKLKHLGFEVFYKQQRYSGSNWHAGMFACLVSMIDRIDTLIIASSDIDLLPLVEYAISKGVYVTVIGCNLAFKQMATNIIPITEAMLEATNEAN